MEMRAKIEEIKDSENASGALKDVLSTAMQDTQSILKKVSAVNVPDIAQSVSSTLSGLRGRVFNYFRKL